MKQHSTSLFPSFPQASPEFLLMEKILFVALLQLETRVVVEMVKPWFTWRINSSSSNTMIPSYLVSNLDIFKKLCKSARFQGRFEGRLKKKQNPDLAGLMMAPKSFQFWPVIKIHSSTCHFGWDFGQVSSVLGDIVESMFFWYFSCYY